MIKLKKSNVKNILAVRIYRKDKLKNEIPAQKKILNFTKNTNDNKY